MTDPKAELARANDDLLRALKDLVKVAGPFGLDFHPAYPQALAAIDRRERADVEAAKAMVKDGAA